MPCLTPLDPSNTVIRQSCSVLFRGLVPFVDTILFRLYNQTYEEINMAKYKAYITVYHMIEIEADTAADARKEATDGTIWDDHIKDVIIDIEQQEE
jgi:hypothetical protein